MKVYQLAILAFSLQLIACSGLSLQSDDDDQPVTETAPPVIEDTEIHYRPFPDDSFYDLLVAEFALRRNRYDLALGNYLQQAYQTQDAGVAMHTTRLAQYLKADKATLDAAQLWIETESDSLEAHYILAIMQAKTQRPLEAMGNMTFVLEQGGKTNFSFIAASAIPLQASIRSQLTQSFNTLRQQYPENNQLLIGSALLAQQREALEEALGLIRQALDHDPADLHAIAIETRLLQQLNREDEAVERLAQVVEQYPNNIRLRLQYARLLMPRDIELAKTQFTLLLSGSPNDPDLLFSLALLSKETGDIAHAEQYFTRLLMNQQRAPEAHFYLGQIEESRKQWQQAIIHYKAIPPGRNFLPAINRIAALSLANGDAEGARHHLQAMRSQYPKHAIRLYLLETEILLKNNQFDDAHQLVSEALLAHPANTDLLYARSMVSEQRNDLPLVEKDLRAILQQDPNNVIALNALGYVLTNLTDRYDEAYQLIAKALELKPEDPAIIDSLGWVEYRRGNLQESRRLLEQAYSSFPDHEVAAHLGEVLWQSGLQKQAVEVWQTAIKRFPNSKILQAVMKKFIPLKKVAEPDGKIINTAIDE
jgi:tetratricopeptide (TPR) repeat protein